MAQHPPLPPFAVYPIFPKRDKIALETDTNGKPRQRQIDWSTQIHSMGTNFGITPKLTLTSPFPYRFGVWGSVTPRKGSDGRDLDNETSKQKGGGTLWEPPARALSDGTKKIKR